jgi:hypothetical protein
LLSSADTRHAIEDFTYSEDYYEKWVLGQVSVVFYYGQTTLR